MSELPKHIYNEKNGLHYGFGTINMKEIVEKNEGCIRFVTTDSKFRVILIMPFGRTT